MQNGNNRSIAYVEHDDSNARARVEPNDVARIYHEQKDRAARDNRDDAGLQVDSLQPPGGAKNTATVIMQNPKDAARQAGRRERRYSNEREYDRGYRGGNGDYREEQRYHRDTRRYSDASSNEYEIRGRGFHAADARYDDANVERGKYSHYPAGDYRAARSYRPHSANEQPIDSRPGNEYHVMPIGEYVRRREGYAEPVKRSGGPVHGDTAVYSQPVKHGGGWTGPTDGRQRKISETYDHRVWHRCLCCIYYNGQE